MVYRAAKYAAALLIYDSLLNIGRELTAIWRRPHNAISWLYIIIRYAEVVRLMMGGAAGPLEDPKVGGMRTIFEAAFDLIRFFQR